MLHDEPLGSDDYVISELPMLMTMPLTAGPEASNSPNAGHNGTANLAALLPATGPPFGRDDQTSPTMPTGKI